MCPFTELDEVLLEETLLADGNKIVLFNDDVHSFDFVIEALMDVCGHELLQAEQCTVIVHYKGKCAVKNGTWEELEPMCTALLERGLTAEIQYRDEVRRTPLANPYVKTHCCASNKKRNNEKEHSFFYSSVDGCVDVQRMRYSADQRTQAIAFD